jgi:hypothetical protein
VLEKVIYFFNDVALLSSFVVFVSVHTTLNAILLDSRTECLIYACFLVLKLFGSRAQG